MSKAHIFAPLKWVKEQFKKVNADVTALNSDVVKNKVINYYRLIPDVYANTSAHKTISLIENRKLTDFDYINMYVIPGGSIYARGFARMARAKFVGHGGMEGTFVAGGTTHTIDVKYINDTQVSVGTSYTGGVNVFLEGEINGYLS